ncbi:hypothetical protein YC2023_060765 [Brassica napus]
MVYAHVYKESSMLHLKRHTNSPPFIPSSKSQTFYNLHGSIDGSLRETFVATNHPAGLVIIHKTCMIEILQLWGFFGFKSESFFENTSEKNVVTWTSMVYVYFQYVDVCEFYRLLSERNLVSWTAMISGFGWNEIHREASLFFSS